MDRHPPTSSSCRSENGVSAYRILGKKDRVQDLISEMKSNFPEWNLVGMTALSMREDTEHG
jgi:hypothetical protein